MTEQSELLKARDQALEIAGLTRAYGEFDVLKNISWNVDEGAWWGIIGPNGSGKSTLLHLLSGVDQPTSGSVHIYGKKVGSYSRKELSRLVAVLQQEGIPPVRYTVREVIEMGRFPHQDWLGREKGVDVEAITERVLARLSLTSLADRTLDRLSGGQRQRVALAKVMVQEPQVLLLDEPTTYLDLRYQLEFMELLAEWRQETGVTIIAVLHDLNLAAQFCDNLLVLKDGMVEGLGTSSDLLTEDRIRRVYGVEPVMLPHPDSGVPQLLLRRSAASTADQ
ncbi:ABC transporter ATP-binding protein [Paenibacillus polymyxa]|uniref:ATP-binding component of ferric enterobactin transport n=1 Tax=Paenibacillus polymyxa TaxID=1406 RepID=A0A378XWE8_PAEPO|nr:ABC transporter ATP-binding protein [Paenibacillus polymyxa]KAE8560582.1 ABC transporter ATP-binding protein [Paenibacillus polymyxa]MBE7897385.1 ABC transporter ATP-binding protein [Paenibacillus polymyxa]MBG9766324.1 ABC transporter ATP-binding protein [Paenibacillus polymyxa]MCC3257363.1 ABC transporter ATP-binding protein [Paenibacillus polymyxa]MCJ1218566.1 ABC transporter ATP-binding protein [Paenibacillus polymyxa]